jgi:hypothetical protein
MIIAGVAVRLFDQIEGVLYIDAALQSQLIFVALTRQKSLRVRPELILKNYHFIQIELS